MRRNCSHLLALAVLVHGLSASVPAQEKEATGSTNDIEAQLKHAMLENIKGTEAEDVEATMKTIHSKSPLYQASRRQLSQIFGKHLGLKYELISFKYLATDGEYAIARAVQRTTQHPPAKVKNHESDMIIAFRKEGGTWKFWNQVFLEFKYLKP